MSQHKKELYGATFYTGAQAAAKLVVNFAIGKAGAAYLGPAGMGLLGQFQSVSLLAQNFSNGAVHNGIVRFGALYGHDTPRLKKYLSTALVISIVAAVATSLIISFLLLFFPHLLPAFSYSTGVYFLLSLSAVFFSLNVLFTSLLNAARDFKSLAAYNIAQSVISLILFVALAKIWALPGAAASTIFVQAVATPLWWLFFRKKYAGALSLTRWQWNREAAVQLSQYSLMTLCTVTFTAASQLAVRFLLMRDVSAAAAGWWEGLNRISNLYIFFASLLISTYMMPKYAGETAGQAHLKHQILINIRLMALVMGVILVSVFLVRHLLIRIIFTSSFLPMTDAMGPHLAGDFFKINAWVLSNYLVARKFTGAFLITDFITQAGFTVACAMGLHSLRDVTIAYAVSNAAYLAMLAGIVIYYFYKPVVHA